MSALPSEAEIRARAEELHILEPGAVLTYPIRRRATKSLVDERNAPKPAAGTEVELVSRTSYPVDGGAIRVDVLFIPNPKEPTHG